MGSRNKIVPAGAKAKAEASNERIATTREIIFYRQAGTSEVDPSKKKINKDKKQKNDLTIADK